MKVLIAALVLCSITLVIRAEDAVERAEKDYAAAIEKIKAESEAKTKAAKDAFIAKLKLEMASRTRAGDLDGALKVRERLTQVEGAADSVETPIRAQHPEAEKKVKEAIPLEDLKLITPAALRKAFAAPARLEGDTLILTCDFTDPRQLTDWVVDGKPTTRYGAIAIAAADSLTLKAHFEGVLTVTGEIAPANHVGRYFETSDGFYVGGQHRDGLYVEFGLDKQKLAEDLFSHHYTSKNDFLPFEFAINKNKIRLTFEKVTLGKQINQQFKGQFRLLGGDGGNQFRKLVISGKIDPTWAKEAFPGK